MQLFSRKTEEDRQSRKSSTTSSSQIDYIRTSSSSLTHGSFPTSNTRRIRCNSHQYFSHPHKPDFTNRLQENFLNHPNQIFFSNFRHEFLNWNLNFKIFSQNSNFGTPKAIEWRLKEKVGSGGGRGLVGFWGHVDSA